MSWHVKSTRVFRLYLSFIDWLRVVCTWAIAGGIIAIVAGIAATILLSTEVFVAAKVCLYISGTVLGFWFLSLPTRILYRILCIFIVTSGIWFLVDHVNQSALKSTVGILEPANDRPFKNDRCTSRAPPGRLFTVYLGSMEFEIYKFPTVLIRSMGEDYFAFDRTTEGSIQLTIRMRSADGKIITAIQDGHFVVNPNNILEMDRPDASSLKVIDQYGNTSLSIRYNSSHYMTITGFLDVPGGLGLTSAGTLDINGPSFWSPCLIADANPAITNIYEGNHDYETNFRVFLASPPYQKAPE